MTSYTKKVVPNCFSCQFKSSCFCDHLEPAAQKVWDTIRLAANFTAGEEIYAESQTPAGLFVVCRGRVKIFSTDARGSQMITWIRHPGEIFGHIALFSRNKYLCSGRSMGSTTLSFIETRTLNRFLNAFPGTYPALLHAVANEVRTLQLKLKETAYKPAKSKVALALINAISYKSRNTAAPAIHGLKRTEIAEITGLALETVVRTLAELEKKKLIKREIKAIKILDYATLLRMTDPHAKK
ncbi:MAG: Crp/Fnr family transcriptional regulator [Elusimicrobiales bacterium]